MVKTPGVVFLFNVPAQVSQCKRTKKGKSANLETFRQNFKIKVQIAQRAKPETPLNVTSMISFLLLKADSCS